MNGKKYEVKFTIKQETDLEESIAAISEWLSGRSDITYISIEKYVREEFKP